MAKPVWNPRDYQRALRDFALDHPRCQWFAGTGVGKTSTALATFDHLRVFGEAERLLVISTKRIARMVWSAEVAKWSTFSHLDVAVAIGTPEQRLRALRSKALVCTINYDCLPWLVDTMGDEWPWDMVIADEQTRLKSMRIDMRTSKTGKQFLRKSGGGTRAFALAKVAHKKVRRWIGMTGTPSPNGLQDTWAAAWFVDGGQRLGRSFSGFKERWFRSIRVGSDAFATKLEPFPHAEAEIKRLLSDITITVEAKDYFDLPPLVKNVVNIPLPKAARDKYREMEREMFTEIDTHEIEAFNAGAKSMKLRQLASGAAYHTVDSDEWVLAHDEKIDALHDIVNEANGEPVLIAYQFKSDLARLKKAFPHGRFFDDNPRTLADFRAGRIPQLFIHPKSGGHGIDGMQDVCRTVIWFSQTWDLEEFEQLNERVGPTRQASAGFDRTVFVHLLVAENTIECEMVERLESKASVQDALKMAMKRRG